MSDHLFTAWLFTKSDIKTVILPQTTFAISSALSGGFTFVQNHASIGNFETLWRLPQVILWIWFNLLVVNISNQRLPGSVLEDSLNKPWRPIASKRWSPDQARQFLLVALPGAIIMGNYFGAFTETITLHILVWMYDDLGGANESILWRNVLNAGGLMCFSAGAMAIITGPITYEWSSKAVIWLVMTGSVIATTVHAQDLPDVVGDSARGRRTVPLVYGENIARSSLAMGILAWSIVCPAFWGLPILGFIPTAFIGGSIAVRTLLYRNEASDAINWKLWCVWFGTIYLLPIFRSSMQIPY